MDKKTKALLDAIGEAEDCRTARPDGTYLLYVLGESGRSGQGY